MKTGALQALSFVEFSAQCKHNPGKADLGSICAGASPKCGVDDSHCCRGGPKAFPSEVAKVGLLSLMSRSSLISGGLEAFSTSAFIYLFAYLFFSLSQQYSGPTIRDHSWQSSGDLMWGPGFEPP